jgi:hypothetical protein
LVAVLAGDWVVEWFEEQVVAPDVSGESDFLVAIEWSVGLVLW